jgi:hypothetical protein
MKLKFKKKVFKRKKNKIKQINFLKIIWRFFLLILIISLPFFTIKFISIRLLNAENLICTIENKTICPKEIENYLKPLKEKNLLTLNCEKFIPEILKNKFKFSNFSYQKQWPKTLKINFNLKKNSYIVLDENKQTFAFDDSGQILHYYLHKNQNFIIKIKSNSVTGNHLDKKIHETVLTFLKANQENNWSIKTIDFSKSEEFLFIVENEDFCSVFDSLDWQNKLNQFDELNKSQEKESLKNKEIDFRFNLIILRENQEICL